MQIDEADDAKKRVEHVTEMLLLYLCDKNVNKMEVNEYVE